MSQVGGLDELLGGAPPSFSTSGDLDARLTALGAALESLNGRMPAEILEPGHVLLERAKARLRLSAEHTVVALAGATGSGKSSTFNAVTGLEIASVGVRRPTTSWATACIWGSRGAQDLLEWLGIPERHQVDRNSLLDTRSESADLDGMVLLDLPDHDSTEVAHHLVVERLVYLADVIVWVMDPQKYADAAIHDRLLRPNAEHAGVMVAVLNHIDEVPASGQDHIVSDARRLLDADGLTEVPLVRTSARTMEGIDVLKTELAKRVATKAASRARISTDVDIVVRDLVAQLGRIPSEADESALRQRLETIAKRYATPEPGPDSATIYRQTIKAVAWPLFKPFVRGTQTDSESGGAHLPAVVGADVRESVRALSDGTVPEVARTLTTVGMTGVDEFATAVVAVPSQQRIRRVPAWAKVLQLVQWLVFLGLLAGLGWVAAIALHKLSGTLIVAGGAALAAAVLGLVIDFVGRLTARGSQEPEPDDVHDERVRSLLAPLTEELRHYQGAARSLAGAGR